MSWQQVMQGVWVYRDSCLVYAVRGPAGMLIVNAGSGQWLDHLAELPDKPVAVALTHYFRDHAAGAVRAAREGLAVYVPEYDRQILADPQQHFGERETYIIYDNLWDLFVPIEAIDIAGVLPDYGRVDLAGLEVEVIPLPGVTLSHSGLGIRLADAEDARGYRDVVFCGEAIHSPGRLARLAPLQYNYNDLPGAANCYYSANVLRKRQPDALLPSLGEPMLSDTDAALAQLQQMLRDLVADRPGMPELLKTAHETDLVKVTDHVYLIPHSGASAWLIVSDSGKAMALDYGYNGGSFASPGYPRTGRRRPLLQGLEALKEQFGIDRIDTVIPSHFHDDHVAGIPLLQRLFGTECWVPETFADLLAEPAAHCFPCNWPVPIEVQRRIPIGQKVQWEEFTFHFGAMNGHTRFSALIGFVADGKRFAHTGDQHFFQNGAAQFADNRVAQNHVYRNGALLGGFDQSARWMRKWRPDIVLTGHTNAIHTDAHYFKLLDDCAADYERLHRRSMALGDGAAHFNVDSWGGWIWPWRVHLAEPGPTEVTVTVRNPYPRAAKMAVRLVGPAGWVGGSATLDADPRAEVSCRLRITPAGACRRQPFAVELIADGQPFGQVAEALMTAGHESF